MCTRVPGIARALLGDVYSICLLQFIPNANKRHWSQWSWDHDKADDVRSDASNPSYSIVSWVCKRLPLLDPDAWFRLGLRSKILFRFPVLNEHQLYHSFVWATHLSIRKSSFLQRTNYITFTYCWAKSKITLPKLYSRIQRAYILWINVVHYPQFCVVCYTKLVKNTA